MWGSTLQVVGGLLTDHIGGKKGMIYGAVGVAFFSLVNAALLIGDVHAFWMLVGLNVLNNMLQPLGSLSVRCPHASRARTCRPCWC